MPHTNAIEIWQQACVVLQQNLSPMAYNTWISTSPLTEFRLIGDDRAIGVITSPTAFHSANIEKNFYAQIKEVLDQVTGRNSELQFRIGEPIQNPDPIVNFEKVTTPSAQIIPPILQDQMEQAPQTLSQTHSPATTVPQVSEPSNISFLQERLKHYAQQVPSSSHSSQPSTSFLATQVSPAASFQTSSGGIAAVQRPYTSTPEGGLFSTQTVQTISLDRARLQAQKAGLRLDYTFDTFAVSTTNEMAHAAALAVSNQPGTAYNPLFIYGGVGVGKTHLMHAVGNNILKNNPEARILYCTGEDFTNEIVNAIQTKKAISFKEKYRTVDVLLIDDVQFIAGKNTVQEEFFHTFNTITKRAGQIILTSDQPPHDIALLEDRLRSRFEAGLMVDIQQPSFELRTAILLIKAQSYHMNIPMNLAQIIASKVDSARKIEGIMKSIKSEVELKHREITPELIDELLRNETTSVVRPQLRVKPYDVIKTVADHYHIKIQTVRGKQRIQSIVRARHIAMYFLKEDLKLPYQEVGRWFNNRDHTSAMHAIKKIEQEMHEDEELRQDINLLRTQLIKISK